MQEREKEATSAVFDREGFLERIGGKEIFLQKLLLSFIRSASEHLAALGGAVGQADSAAIRMHAHAIKGAAASIGAGRLKELSEFMETAAKAGEMADMAIKYSSLEQAFDQFKRVAAESLTDQVP